MKALQDALIFVLAIAWLFLFFRNFFKRLKQYKAGDSKAFNIKPPPQSKNTRKKTEQELARFYTFNQAEKIGFVQDCVILVHETVLSNKDGTSYAWHRLYKNQHGHYFLFICNNNDEPYFTHLAPERAKNFLLDAPHIRQQEFPEGAPK